MELYYLVLLNSFQSSIFISLYSENAWFAALCFGWHNVNMWLATVVAVAGSSVATAANFMVGYYLAWRRDDWLALSETIYQRLSRYSRYAMCLLLFPVPALPVAGMFWGIYVIAIGFLRAPLMQSMLFIVIGRIAYYGLYLLR
jgi:membrane protein YqaA with SNARE-associated domain